MTPGYAFAVALSVVVVLAIVGMLFRRRIREKYVGIWLLVAAGVVFLALFPSAAAWLARLVGVATPTNVLFCIALVVLLAVTLQLSTELSATEERVRTLAEELSLLTERLERQETGRPKEKAIPPETSRARTTGT